MRKQSDGAHGIVLKLLWNLSGPSADGHPRGTVVMNNVCADNDDAADH